MENQNLTKQNQRYAEQAFLNRRIGVLQTTVHGTSNAASKCLRPLTYTHC